MLPPLISQNFHKVGSWRFGSRKRQSGLAATKNTFNTIWLFSLLLAILQGLAECSQRALLHTLMQGPRLLLSPASQHKMGREGGGSLVGGWEGPGPEVLCLTPLLTDLNSVHRYSELQGRPKGRGELNTGEPSHSTAL